MHYIVGYEFVCNSKNRPATRMGAGSIQTQLANKKPTYQIKENDSSESSFINGHRYKLRRISKVTLETKEIKVSYMFSDLTDSTLSDINILMDSTSLGDDYIARLSNSVQTLQEQRKAVSESAVEI